MKGIQSADDTFTRYSGVELRHLRLVFTVAEEGNLSRASERLRLTPSALSHQLRAIEAVAGAPVFHRDGKRMRLTPAGEVLFEAASRVLVAIADAEDRIAHLKDGHSGTVRICTHCYTGYHWLPAAIRTFKASHPGADVRVVGEATTRALDALLEREIDLAITTEKTDNTSLVARPVLRDEVLLLVPADHRVASKAWVGPADIAAETLLGYARDPDDSSLCLEILKPHGLRPRKFMNIQLTEAIIELVRAGTGVAAFASWALKPHLEKGDLVAKRITRKGWHRTWNAVTWPKEISGPLVASFVDCLAVEFASRKAERKPAA
ncbi:MAG TPA: LysR family transcriptional regulator [Opitutaceae bacterium]|nr:LysR family transcriptional regulator [Opitutaceae bacterium]